MQKVGLIYIVSIFLAHKKRRQENVADNEQHEIDRTSNGNFIDNFHIAHITDHQLDALNEANEFIGNEMDVGGEFLFTFLITILQIKMRMSYPKITFQLQKLLNADII